MLTRTGSADGSMHAKLGDFGLVAVSCSGGQDKVDG
jgi:hypothetical protein